MISPQPAESPITYRHVRLRPRRSAPRIARKLVREMCLNLRLPVRLIDDAMLVTSELVTSGARQARSALDVSVEIDKDRVTVRVEDDGASRWRGDSLGWTSHSHARDVVARLSTSWGYYRCADGRGSWAALQPPGPQRLGRA